VFGREVPHPIYTQMFKGEKLNEVFIELRFFYKTDQCEVDLTAWKC